MTATTVSGAESVWAHGNEHLKQKLKFFSPKMAIVVKYIIKKLRKYNDSEFFESNKTIANECNVSLRTVINAITRANKLGIFEVSNRYEETLNGKYRQTTNLIKLKKFQEFQLVKNVKTTVKKVESAIRTVIEKATDTVKKATKPFTPKRQQNTHSRPYNAYNTVRVESIPSWFKKEYIPPQLSVNEQEQFNKKREELQQRLRKKYGDK